MKRSYVVFGIVYFLNGLSCMKAMAGGLAMQRSRLPSYIFYVFFSLPFFKETAYNPLKSYNPV
jgi:hypothetical protein